jgi:proteasome accessory factor BC
VPSTDRLDRLERLTDLVLVLLDATQPLSLEAIGQRVPGYPDDHDARRQAFERDKRLLRDEGIPVLTEKIEGNEQFGYRINPDAFYLSDLTLEPDEQAALHLAVAGVHLGDPSGRHALLKLGAVGVADARPVASLVPPEALVDLFEAVRSRSVVTFSYRSEARRVAPAGLWFRHGRWYLVAWDLEREAGRTFRVDRFDGRAQAEEPGTASLPEDFDVAGSVPDEPWRASGEDTDEVLLRVDAIEGPRVVEEVGAASVVEQLSDGGALLRLGVSSYGAMRSWVLGLLTHAEVVAPHELRDAMVTWLEAIVEQDHAPGGETTHAATSASAAYAAGDEAEVTLEVDAGVVVGETADRRSSGPTRDASLRLRRLLALMGWLARVGEASIAEIVERFGIDADELVSELELAACCGLPPYSPDVLMEIEVDEESVRAFLPPEMARPRRLTPAEGFSLAASARMILAVPGADQEGALARALAKLDVSLGSRQGLVVDLDAPVRLDEVRDAVDNRQQIEIEYHSASADEVTTRVVDPRAILLLDGHWYLDGYCHRAEGVRRFRVDRIRRVQSTGVTLSAGGPLGAVPESAADLFVPGPGSVSVTLSLGARSSWIVDSLPLESVGPTVDGRIAVSLSVGGRPWLERLLLQLGPDAYVVAPPEMASAAKEAAERVLALYH